MKVHRHGRRGKDWWVGGLLRCNTCFCIYELELEDGLETKNRLFGPGPGVYAPCPDCGFRMYLTIGTREMQDTDPERNGLMAMLNYKR